MKKLGKIIILILVMSLTAMFGVVACNGGNNGAKGAVASIEMNTLPTKTEYNVGETVSYDGATILVTYKNGTTEIIAIDAEGVITTTVNTNRAGEKTVNVRYGDGRTSFKINVVEKAFVFTYDLNYAGSTAAVRNVVENGRAEDISAERDGYTFYKWYDDKDCTSEHDFTQAVTADTTVYAFWHEDGATYYNFTYDLNYYGVVKSAFVQSVKSGDPARRLVDPSRSEFAFVQWNTSADGDTAYDATAAITADTTVYASWNKTKTGSSSYTFEAENTDLSGKTGPGSSGEAIEEGMIVTDNNKNASGNAFVSYLYKNNLSLEFDIACSEDVDDVTLEIGMGYEFSAVTITDTEYTVVVFNGEDDETGTRVQYGSITFAANENFSVKVTATVKLTKGFNRIQLTTANSKNPSGEGMGTYAGTAPMIDFVRLTTTAVLTWDGTKGLPKNY